MLLEKSLVERRRMFQKFDGALTHHAAAGGGVSKAARFALCGRVNRGGLA